MHELEHGPLDGLQVAFLENQVAGDAFGFDSFESFGEVVYLGGERVPGGALLDAQAGFGGALVQVRG